jgi:hypothetical protein
MKAAKALELRMAVECLPYDTRLAMLEALESEPILAGAFVDGSGSMCPMLAAKRRGASTGVKSFARAWDVFTGTADRRARRASSNELVALRGMIEASIGTGDPASSRLTAAVAELKAGKRRGAAALQERSRPRPGDRDRTPELRGRQGWAWARLFRRYDEYEQLLAQLAADSDAAREEERAGARR